MYLPSLHLKGIIQQLLKNSDARHVIRHTKKGRKQSKVLQNQLSFQNKKIYSNPWTQNWVTVQSCREEKLYGLGHHSSFKYPPFWRISRLQLRKGQWKQIFFPSPIYYCIAFMSLLKYKLLCRMKMHIYGISELQHTLVVLKQFSVHFV